MILKLDMTRRKKPLRSKAEQDRIVFIYLVCVVCVVMFLWHLQFTSCRLDFYWVVLGVGAVAFICWFIEFY